MMQWLYRTRTWSWPTTRSSRPRVTLYVIRRDHCVRTGFFYVSVPEVHEYGFGCQAKIGPMVIGASLTRAT